VTTVFTPNTRVAYLSGGAEYDIDFNSQQEGKSASRITYAAVTSRSHHSGMVNVLLTDGSVRPITNGVDVTIWRALGTRQGGELTGDL
jgi:prepilin-type processing-associated H-X9-DG protein